MTRNHTAIKDLSDRNREVFQTLVEMYLETGAPIGSRTLSRDIHENVSSATIRNAMQDLEHLGLLSSPHISAGRIPTELGLRMFVDELLEVSQVDSTERDLIDSIGESEGDGLVDLMDRTGSVLAGLTRGASLVLAPKGEPTIKHVEFVPLAPDRALVVLVTADGRVENRIFEPPVGQTASAMREAANFLNSIAQGRTVKELHRTIAAEIELRRSEIDELATDLVERGIAVWETAQGHAERLIVRGRSHLLESKELEQDMDRIRMLFDDLDRKRDIADFLEAVEGGEGVRVFIGSENQLFSLTGSTLVMAPYMSNDRKIVGAVGVIGPTRLNYGRIVPIVDYTAQLVGRFVSETQ